MPTGRPLVKRAALWTGAVLLALAGYSASAPFAFFLCQRHRPGLIPTLQVVYAPLMVYSRHPDWPGSEPFNRFQSWSYATIQEYTSGPARASDVLDSLTDIQFTGTPLREVADYLGEIHDIPIELDGDVNGDIEITINSKASARDTLQQMLEPHGLVAAPDDGRIVIGTPEAIARITDQRRAANPLVVWGRWIALVVALIVVGMAALLFRRMIVKRRSPATTVE